MLSKNLRTSPAISVDAAGQIKWTAPTLDYNPSLFYRGKTVTNDEFNNLFNKQTAHSNYTTDSLHTFLTNLFPTAVWRQVQANFDFSNSYIGTFGKSTWAAATIEDGYYTHYYVPKEHGIHQGTSSETRTSIEADMFVFNADGALCKVEQVEIYDDTNTVKIYSDNPDLEGYVVIRANRKQYALAAQNQLDASLITGLHDVALTGDYEDLINKPDAKIEACEDTLATIIEQDPERGTIVKHAKLAEDVEHILNTTTFPGGKIYTDLFEEGTGIAKNADIAKRYKDSKGTTHSLSDLWEIIQGNKTVPKATSANHAYNAAKINGIILQENAVDGNDEAIYRMVSSAYDTAIPQRRLLFDLAVGDDDPEHANSIVGTTLGEMYVRDRVTSENLTDRYIQFELEYYNYSSTTIPKIVALNPVYCCESYKFIQWVSANYAIEFQYAYDKIPNSTFDYNFDMLFATKKNTNNTLSSYNGKLINVRAYEIIQ